MKLEKANVRVTSFIKYFWWTKRKKMKRTGVPEKKWNSPKQKTRNLKTCVSTQFLVRKKNKRITEGGDYDFKYMITLKRLQNTVEMQDIIRFSSTLGILRTIFQRCFRWLGYVQRPPYQSYLPVRPTICKLKTSSRQIRQHQEEHSPQGSPAD